MESDQPVGEASEISDVLARLREACRGRVRHSLFQTPAIDREMQSHDLAPTMLCHALAVATIAADRG